MMKSSPKVLFVLGALLVAACDPMAALAEIKGYADPGCQQADCTPDPDPEPPRPVADEFKG